jgi:pre-mRNA-processing factor 6
MKSAVFERQQGQSEQALGTVQQGLAKYPKFAKLHMIQGQLLAAQGNVAGARAAYAAGLKACPKEPILWVLASRLEEADGKSIRARALLEKARQVNPASDVLWAEAVGVEERSGGAAQAKAMLARGTLLHGSCPALHLTYASSALQECPTSGQLWSLAIWAEPRPARRARSADAIKKAADDARVVCTVARLFWAERKVEKAREWFARAVKANPDMGDVWAWWLKFERQHGTEEHRVEVRNRCAAAEPRHGAAWQPVAKDDKNRGKTPAEIVELVADVIQ